MNRVELQERLESFGLTGKSWGRHGEESREELERFVGRHLSTDLADFVERVGNAMIGPFGIIVAGSEDRSVSALTESADLPPSIGVGLKTASRAAMLMERASMETSTARRHGRAQPPSRRSYDKRLTEQSEPRRRVAELVRDPQSPAGTARPER